MINTLIRKFPGRKSKSQVDNYVVYFKLLTDLSDQSSFIEVPTELEIENERDWDYANQCVREHVANFRKKNEYIRSFGISLIKSIPDLVLGLTTIDEVRKSVLYIDKYQETLSTPTLSLVIRDYLIDIKHTFSYESWVCYRREANFVLKCFGDKQVTKVFDPDIWKLFVFDLINGKFGNNANTTIKLKIMYIQYFLEWLGTKGIIDTHACIWHMEQQADKVAYFQKKKGTLEKKEILALLQVRGLYTDHQVVRDAFLFGCATGLRISDILKVSTGWLSEKTIKGTKVKYIEFFNTKTNDLTVIPLNSLALEVFERNAERVKTGPIFFSHVYREKEYNKQIKKIAKMAGLNRIVNADRSVNNKKERVLKPLHQELTFHWGRTTFAETFLNSGGDLRILKELMQHKSFNTTLKYTPKRKTEDVLASSVETL